MPLIYDMGQTVLLPSEGRRAEDFFALKNQKASVRFELANLGTKGQHATCRPPKPPSYTSTLPLYFPSMLFLQNLSIKLVQYT